MRFTISREKLQEGLTAVAASIPAKTTLPVLANILVETTDKGIRLSGTDLDIAVSTEVAADVEAAGAITIPASVLDRWNGPAVIESGAVIPRNALEGLPLHKVDLHLTKNIRLGGSARVELVAEVFNLFNHANYGSYNVSLSATAPATTALFGTPNQNTGTAYVPRQGQLGFKISF